MSRPETIKDVKDRLISVGRIEFDKIALTPALLKHYTGMIETIEKMGGEVESEYSGVSMRIPRTTKQLEDQLRTEQYSWDDSQKKYRQAVKADPTDPVSEYQRDRVTKWAKEEGLPDPFDPFAANDEELQRIRREFGFED